MSNKHSNKQFNEIWSFRILPVVERDGVGVKGEKNIRVHSLHKTNFFHVRSQVNFLQKVEINQVIMVGALLFYF